jgi:hypothetical protein
MRMEKLFVVVPAGFFLAALALSGACREDDDDDVPPRVVGVEPSATIVPVTTSFRLLFSEELNVRTVGSDPAADNLTIILVPRLNASGGLTLSDAFLSDFRRPPLIESRQDAVVPIDLALEADNHVVRVTPRSPLRRNTAYTLVVSGELRDTAGNPLVGPDGTKQPFFWELVTDAGQPEVVRTDIGGSGIVVPNRRRITVFFNQPVLGISNDTLRIEGSPAPKVQAILLDETASAATFFLDELGAGCERLAPNSQYELVASAGIRALTGEQLAPYREPLTVSGACDLVPNVLSGLASTAADVSASVRFTTTKPSTTEVRWGLSGGPLDCLGAPCPAIGTPTTTANALHGVAITGLTVNVDYDFVVSAEDEVGFVATGRGAFRTAPLPKIAINEALADAQDGVPDAAGEFVELTSHEDSDVVDVTGWVLRVTKLSGGAPGECTIPPTDPLTPGAFLVLADATFDFAIYPGIPENLVLRFAAFCGRFGLQNEPLFLELIDPGLRTVSSMTTGAPRPGRSVERIRPDAPDEPASFCLSRSDVGPTPGRENGVTGRGCE